MNFDYFGVSKSFLGIFWYEAHVGVEVTFDSWNLLFKEKMYITCSHETRNKNLNNLY